MMDEERSYNPITGRLFKAGKFTLHSGLESDWIIDCKELTDDDLETLAYLGSKIVKPFSTIRSIPTGGDRFAAKMQRYISTPPEGEEEYGVLIVDDVFTSGTSMQQAREKSSDRGLVIFARSYLPWWCDAVFHFQNYLKGGTG